MGSFVLLGRCKCDGMIAGESVLICKPNEKNAAKILAGSELAPVKSCLFSSKDATSLSSSMKRAILEVKAWNTFVCGTLQC